MAVFDGIAIRNLIGQGKILGLPGKLMGTSKGLLIGILLAAATFDSIVVPYLRISIADCCLLIAVFVLGFHRSAVANSALFFGAIVPVVLVSNAVIFLMYSSGSTAPPANMALLVSGFVRPFFFVFLAILFYGLMKQRGLERTDVAHSVRVGGCIIAAVVALQYVGIFPPMYHNNPSFGEEGRFTIFSEGWRPTGLTNEASFVGIFLFLFFVAAITFTKRDEKIGFANGLANWLIFIGCLLSTSRLAVALAVVFFVMVRPTFSRLLSLGLAVPLLLLLVDVTRFENMFAFEGDASTLERYGSVFAHFSALTDASSFFGTGYLNSTSLVTRHLDPLVLSVLGDRKLPSFSLPLQLMVEFGPFLFALMVFVSLVKYKEFLYDIRFIAVFAVSAVTGIQNFVFVYVFVALLIYEKNSRST